jgi:hypothetical protein
VWNGAGEAVPHAIRALYDETEAQGAQLEVPLFGVPAGSALADDARPATARACARATSRSRSRATARSCA